MYFIKILIFAPDAADIPHSLGQIWYLRVLIFCTLISPFVFLAAMRNKYYLLLPVGVALFLAIIQTELKFHRNFFYLGHNLVQEIMYGGYFFMGSFVFRTDWRNKKGIISLLLLLSILTAIFFLPLVGGNLKLGSHSYAPNTYYFPLGAAGILIVLLFANVFERIFEHLKLFARMLDFCSKHSYGIYLNHSFFIVFYEHIFGLKAVMDSPSLAFIKVSLVLCSSLLFAIPITYVSINILQLIRRLGKDKLLRVADQ